MKIGILPIGHVDSQDFSVLAEDLSKTFPDTTCTVINEALPLDEQFLNKKRKQYSSNMILNAVKSYAAAKPCFDVVLGVVDADIFVAELNYVFGEAFVSGGAALVSVWRLKPEFYREKADLKVFHERLLKESIHEVGHTLGLHHCPHTSCVMHFSNSIFDTDKKQNLFCDDCYLQAALAINNLG
jgi:archaemetzincin